MLCAYLKKKAKQETCDNCSSVVKSFAKGRQHFGSVSINVGRTLVSSGFIKLEEKEKSLMNSGCTNISQQITSLTLLRTQDF